MSNRMALLDFGTTRAYCPLMFRARLRAAAWFLLLATAAVGQPAPSSRIGGWLDVGVDEWFGSYGQVVLGQMWGRRAVPDGIRLVETFELSRELGWPRYEALARFNVVTPLGRAGSFQVGLSPSAGYEPLNPGAPSADLTSSAGLVLNADDWDFMVAPDEMTYRGPGLRLDFSYGIWDLLELPSRLSHSASLDLAAPWTVRFDRMRLEVGPSVKLHTYSSSSVDRWESRGLGGQVLLAGGSRLVDIFVAPEYYAAGGPGYELSVSATHWTYRESDTALGPPGYLYVTAQARAVASVRHEFYAQPELVVLIGSNDDWPDWTPRLRPSVALVRRWTVRPGCVLAVQFGAALPIGFGHYFPFLYNEDVALDARVGLCGARRPASR
jgi:hypothetical protein